MKLEILFPNLRFSESVIRRAVSVMEGLPSKKKEGKFSALSITKGFESWSFEEAEEFYAQYVEAGGASCWYRVPLKEGIEECELWFSLYSGGSTVSVSSPSRIDIHSIMNVFQSSKGDGTLIDLPEPERHDSNAEDGEEKQCDFNIFIGHGHSTAWKLLKDHLQDKHDFDIIAFESGARAGHVTRDILDEILEQSSMAFLVLTAEDETSDGEMRARQNVIHETGLFQGRLGFSKAIVLLEEGVEEFSNIAGIQYIPFPKGQIQSTFGDVVATINREQKRRR